MPLLRIGWIIFLNNMTINKHNALRLKVIKTNLWDKTIGQLHLITLIKSSWITLISNNNRARNKKDLWVFLWISQLVMHILSTNMVNQHLQYKIEEEVELLFKIPTAWINNQRIAMQHNQISTNLTTRGNLTIIVALWISNN